MEPLSSDELILGSAEMGGSEGTGGHTVDRWKRKEAIKTIAGYVQALSLLSLAAVESLENNLSNILSDEKAADFFETPVKGMLLCYKHSAPASFSFVFWTLSHSHRCC